MYLRGADYSRKAMYDQPMTTLNGTLIFDFKVAEFEHKEQPLAAKTIILYIIINIS